MVSMYDDCPPVALCPGPIYNCLYIGRGLLALYIGDSCCFPFVACVYREYWMIYSGPRFLAVVWYGSSPPLPVSKLSLFLSLPMCRRSSLRVRGWGRSQFIRQGRESLVLCKSFNTLCLCINHKFTLLKIN
jgi:hypothetical protein